MHDVYWEQRFSSVHTLSILTLWLINPAKQTTTKFQQQKTKSIYFFMHLLEFNWCSPCAKLWVELSMSRYSFSHPSWTNTQSMYKHVSSLCLSYLLTSHWSKQVIWPNLKPRGRKMHITHLKVLARVWMYNSPGKGNEELQPIFQSPTPWMSQKEMGHLYPH